MGRAKDMEINNNGLEAREKKRSLGKVIFSILAGAILCVFPGNIFAQSFSISAEIPASYSFKKADDGSKLKADGLPSGMLLYLKLPFSVGFGLESYEIALQDYGNNKISTQMADIFYTLSIFSIDFTLGAGIGKSKVTGDQADFYEETTSSQYFLKLGIPIFSAINLNLGYHQIKAQIKESADDSKGLEAGGDMMTFGMGISF